MDNVTLMEVHQLATPVSSHFLFTAMINVELECTCGTSDTVYPPSE